MAAKWKEIYLREKELIAGGSASAGDLLYTVSGLADRYGVCYVTAHRVARLLADDGLICNLPKVGCVRAKVKKDFPVYLLSPAETNQTEGNLMHSLELKGIYSEADSLGINIQPVDLAQLLHLTVETPSVLIYFPGGNYLSSDLILKFLPRNIFPVGVNSCFCQLRGDSVGSDSRQVMEGIIRYFLDRGLVRIGYLGPYDSEVTQSRFDAFYDAVAEAGVKFEPEWIFSLGNIQNEHHAKILKWIENNELEAICTPGLAFLLGLQKFLPASLVRSLKFGTVGRPWQECIASICMCPDYEMIGRTAVQVVRNLDLEESGVLDRREFHAVPANSMISPE